MATVTLDPNAATDGVSVRKVSGAKSLKSTTTLTASYVATDEVVTWEYELLKFVLTYVKGDETTVEILLESSDDGGTTWRKLCVAETPSSGVSALVPHVLQLTPADWSATDYPSFDVDVRAASRVRVKVKATGGTPTGTYAVSVVGGWKLPE